MRSILVSFSLFLSFMASAAELPYYQGETLPFTRTEVLRASELVDHILRRYPQEQHHFVFVGRSLILLKALMDLRGIANTGLPFSGHEIKLKFSSDRGQQLEARLLEHFDRHLPSPQDLHGRQLILVDFVVTGRGLRAARKALNWYYEGREPLHLVRVSAYLSSFRFLNFSFLSRSRESNFYVDENSRFGRNLIDSVYDLYAPYGSFDPTTGVLQTRTEQAARYELLLNWISSLKPAVLPLAMLQCRQLFSR